MLPKVAHVIIIGLSDEERGKLDDSTRRILCFSDSSWEYKSYGCPTLEEAVTMAKDMARVDMLYIPRETRPDPAAGEKFGIQLDWEIAGELMRNHPSKPVLSYSDPARPKNKLAAAILALWRDRNTATTERLSD
jgi:hypothetical protein